MSVDRFRFVSPGVFINEIDQSQIPQESSLAAGPAIIGRTAHGPAFVPTTVGSFDEFVQIFGNPLPGGGSGDVWRDGNRSAPTYAAYAAQAYLANSGPVTMVRLLGDESPNASGTGVISKAGWKYPNVVQDTAGGPYGLFMFQSGAAEATLEGFLAAVFYLSSSANINLVGKRPEGASIIGANATVLDSIEVNSAQELKVRIMNAANTTQVESTFNFDKTSSRYIRI